MRDTQENLSPRSQLSVAALRFVLYSRPADNAIRVKREDVLDAEEASQRCQEPVTAKLRW